MIRELDDVKHQLAQARAQSHSVEAYNRSSRPFGQGDHSMPPPPVPTSSQSRKRVRDNDGSVGKYVT
jgi:hypothetical protein